MSLLKVSEVAASLLERGSELRAIDELILRTGAGTGRLVVVAGEAGIGKSTVLHAAVERASATGLRTLRSTGSELESHYPYGAAIRLFEPIIRDDAFDHEQLFGGPATVTAPLFLAGAEPVRAPGDPFAAIHGLYWLAINAAERGPLLLVIDDAQWVDAASLRFFHYLGSRAPELPISLVLAFRSGEPGADERVVRQLQTEASALQLRPAPLSEAAIGALLAAATEDLDDPAIRRACWEASGGNPFFVTELIWELRRGFLERGPDGAVDLAALVPERIARSIQGRLGRLERGVQRFAEVVAVLGEEADLRRATHLAGLSPGNAADAVRELAGAGILDSGGSLSFVHPIVRSAVYSMIPAVLLARLHREAALVLRSDGAPLGVVVGQLLAAEPAGDLAMVDVLLEAARQARIRGESQVAILQLNRALKEPPTAEQRLEVIVELARAEAAIGAATAAERYGEALAMVADRRRKAELLLELGHAQVSAADWRAGAATFEQGALLLTEDDGELRSQLEAGALSTAWVSMDRPAEINRKIEEILASRTLGPENRQLAAWIAFQRGATVTSTAPEMARLVERVTREAPMEVLVNEGQLIEVVAGLLLTTDELHSELELLTRALDAVERAGSFAKVGVYAYCRAWPQYYTGRLTDAIADAQAALRAAELGWEVFYPAACTVLTLALLERADLEAAEAILTFDEDRWAGRIDTAMLVPMAKGRVHLERGDNIAALAAIRSAGVNASSVGQRGQIPTEWRTWTTEALIRLGRRDEARELAAEGVEIARTWAARWPLGSALRVAGVAEGGPKGLGMLREAVTLLEGSPARLECARALVELGAALRRNGSLLEARRVLGQGMDVAHRLGALKLLERSRAELRAAGARPRRYVTRGVEALTPAEQRVAQLALAGRTNRDIAQTLFVTPKAVEYHLANTYRKLGIGSRQELASALATGP